MSQQGLECDFIMAETGELFYPELLNDYIDRRR